MRVEAAPWLAAAAIYLRLQRCCRTVPPEETEAWVVERVLATHGLTGRWEGNELVVELPGWTPPPPRVVAVQPGLFEESAAAEETEAQGRRMR